MKVTSLHDLFIDQLKDIYSAEKQIVQALPKMAKAAQSPDVKQAFQEHLEMTKNQVERLNTIFERMGSSAGRKKCMGMEGLVKETEEFMGEQVAHDVIDAGLIANAQRIEHYEIAAYGTVRTYAEMMGHREAAQLLQQTLDEEGETDKKLSMLAERGINAEAQKSPNMQRGKDNSGM
jgi:ferritin-like metal-binding protein YciE